MLRRLWALALRHIYLHLGSWPRVVEMMYWPLVNIASWGFTSIYLTQKFTGIQVVGSTMVAAVVLMEFFMRPTMMALTLFMEELWSRNLGHLFASPLKTGEYAVGLMLVTFVRASIALIPLLIVARYVFGFSILSLGWTVVAYIPLMMLNGCFYGLLIVALILRLGLSAEWLAWMATWLLSPFLAPYFPVSVLPGFMQKISWSLAPTYVFDSLRQQLATGLWNSTDVMISAAITLVYGIMAALLFRLAYRNALKNGRLLQNGE